MTIRPNTLEEIREALSAANSRGEKIERVELGALNRILEYSPEDMTVSVEAGIILSELQRHLAFRGQWLPIDPPRREHLTVDALLSGNLSGPRRFGCGTIRDYLIGLKIVLSDGRLIKTGGKVVKNVAGYDLGKLFVGSRGTLGVMVEATFKLKPISEVETFVEASFDSIEVADDFLIKVLDSELTPVVLDLHNLGNSRSNPLKKHTVVLGFAGMREDVAYQVELAKEIGAGDESSLDHESRFWDFSPGKLPARVSVLPSRLAQAVGDLGEREYVARAGNGLVWHWGKPAAERADLPFELFERVKLAFDPNRIFPEIFL